MKWVTRERPKIDRIACPWLVARFIDQAPMGLVFDIGYSYMDLGKSGAGSGFITTFVNGVQAGGFVDPGTEANARSSAVNFTVRWEF